MRKSADTIIFSPSDLITFVASPFASWMDRYYLENKDLVKPDEESEETKLIAETGDIHEQAILAEMEAKGTHIAKIERGDFGLAVVNTTAAIKSRVPIVFQAALQESKFAGYADFLILNENDAYELWDTKLARSPKPYYAVQLCCYAEMYAATTEEPMPEKFGIILGTGQKVVFRTEDFYHYYKRVKNNFLEMQENFTNDLKDCPEPLASADHGRWQSHADRYFADSDHLVQVAGITTGQIKKLVKAGIATMSQLAEFTDSSVHKLANDTLIKLVAQARLQCGTKVDRLKDPTADARYELIAKPTDALAAFGLELLPTAHPADVFFDMEGYPLAVGGLEYLFGATTNEFEFFDWWAHDRGSEKAAFEGFIDWIFERWIENPDMHVYHYAAYEESALRRLSIRHDTRQEEVDELLRNDVLVDLYKVVRQGIRIGEASYSIKSVELLYRPKRTTQVATAAGSIVQYARWIESGQAGRWQESEILKAIRDYNEDDCRSTVELFQWLTKLAADNGINYLPKKKKERDEEPTAASQELAERLQIADQLREKNEPIAKVLGDLIDFHRREQKPVWWRMFDRAEAEAEELSDDPACIYEVRAIGAPRSDKQSQIQDYTFDGLQECKMEEGKQVMFCHDLDAKFTLIAIDSNSGRLSLKIGNKALNEKMNGQFPSAGSLILSEYVPAKEIQAALGNIGREYLAGIIPGSILALLSRARPVAELQKAGEDTVSAAIRVSQEMRSDCLVIQGPPGTGKTFTGSNMIANLLEAGKNVGVASNSHKAVVNLLIECGKAMRGKGHSLAGIKAGGESTGELFTDNAQMRFVSSNKDAANEYRGGLIAGTAWLFSRPELQNKLDFLFIDEAGQVSLANAVAMARSAANLVLLGDQMQLEQPLQGSHPGDSGLSVLQYALKDEKLSLTDAPVFHAVVPADYGLFLGQSRRMHPAVCRFISESIYENRLESHEHCERQKIDTDPSAEVSLPECGVAFINVEHDGNIQQSDEEATMVNAIFRSLVDKNYTASDGTTRKLALLDFLFISPYNSQVRTLKEVLPEGARVASVDKFQGQEAPVCVLSMCSSYGEYGSRGLSFILDKNRVNVAISRAQCLAVIVGDARIAQTSASSLDEMRLLNLYCKLAL